MHRGSLPRRSPNKSTLLKKEYFTICAVSTLKLNVLCILSVAYKIQGALRRRDQTLHHVIAFKKLGQEVLTVVI